MPLRYCYMKTGDPKSWERLNSLECHSQKRVETDKYEADRFGVVNLLKRFYNITEFSDEEILRICGVIQINGHEVPLSDPGHVSVFWRGSMFEHNCRANCSKSFTDHGELLVRAMEDIPKGGHLSICYTDPLWATGARQMHLSQTKYFSCSCQRCKDPTELGHFLSAIKCTTGECGGRMLPTAEVKNWQCDRCGTKVGEEKVAAVLSQLGSLVSTVNKADPVSCQKYLEQALTLVPESHYLVREVQLALAQLYGQTVPGGIQALTDEEIHHKDLLCRKLIKFTDSLIPAECRIRGVLHFELHAAVAEATRRRASQGLIDSGDVYASLMESKGHLERAKDLLKFEPEILPEGKIAKQIEINLKDLETVLRGIHVSVGVSPM